MVLRVTVIVIVDTAGKVWMAGPELVVVRQIFQVVLNGVVLCGSRRRDRCSVRVDHVEVAGARYEVVQVLNVLVLAGNDFTAAGGLSGSVAHRTLDGTRVVLVSARLK